jgi:long-chain fatty acid transport protein
MDTSVVVGLFRFTPSSTPPGQVVPPNGYSRNIKPKFIPLAFFYITHQISSKWTVGFATFTPFGLSANSTNFNDADPNLTKFVGRFAGTRVRLESYWFQPTVAYKINENLAISVAPAFVHTHLFLEESILNPLGYDDGLKFGRTAAPTILPGLPVNQAAAIIARLLPEGRSRIAGTGNAPAISAGLLWKHPRTRTNIGLLFRSPVVTHLSGQASFAFGNQPYPLEQYVGSSFLPNAFPNQKVTSSFATPATYGVGFANSKFWNTTFAFDVKMQDYKKFKNVPLNFPINEDTPGLKNIALPAVKYLNFNFRESWNFSVGAQHAVNDKLTLRAGYQFDLSPVVEQSVGPLFPDANRHSFTVGGSRKAGNAEFTFFYEAMKFVDRTTLVPANNYVWTNGNYDNFAHVGGLGLRFDMSDLIKKHF